MTTTKQPSHSNSNDAICKIDERIGNTSGTLAPPRELTKKQQHLEVDD